MRKSESERERERERDVLKYVLCHTWLSTSNIPMMVKPRKISRHFNLPAPVVFTSWFKLVSAFTTLASHLHLNGSLLYSLFLRNSWIVQSLIVLTHFLKRKLYGRAETNSQNEIKQASRHLHAHLLTRARTHTHRKEKKGGGGEEEGEGK